MIKTRRIAAVVLAALIALTIASCSSEPQPRPAAPAGTDATQAPIDRAHNAADMTFVQGMIPHHSQAVAMSQQADQKAESPQVKELASAISAAQGPEIGYMNRMLSTWGAPPAGGMPRMDHGSTPGMGSEPMVGMMSSEQMGQLAGQSGRAFDRMFLEMMTAHHQGAIEMSRTELAQGQNPQAKQLAQAIIDAQQAELATMRNLLVQG